MGLQQELAELRDVVQALCDYVGHDVISARLAAIQKARAEATARARVEGATQNAVPDQGDKTTP